MLLCIAPDSLGQPYACETNGCVRNVRLGPATRYERRNQLKKRQPRMVARQKGSVGYPDAIPFSPSALQPSFTGQYLRGVVCVLMCVGVCVETTKSWGFCDRKGMVNVRIKNAMLRQS